MSTKSQILHQYKVISRENALLALFMEKGPKFLCNYLGLESTQCEEWEVIFDYLVIDRNALFALSKRYYEHFLSLYENNGPKALRAILGVKTRKYDAIWQPIHDLFGIAEEGILKYVHNSRFSLSREIEIYGSDKVRENLEIDHQRYSQTWEQVLDILLNHHTEQYLSNTNVDRLMGVFVAQMNLRRAHSGLYSKSGTIIK